MALGEVLWYDRRRGYGFIRPDLGPRDVFVHAAAVRRSGIEEVLQPGLRVEFELIQLRDGRLAAHELRVEVADRASAGSSDAKAGGHA